MLSNFRKPSSFAISGTSEQTFLTEISLRTSALKPDLKIIASEEGAPDQEITIHRLLSSLPKVEGNVSVALPLHFFKIVMVSLPVMPKGAISKALPYHLAKAIDKPLQDFVYDWLLTSHKKDTLEITVYLFPIVTFNNLLDELTKRNLKLKRLEPDVFAAFAYLDLTRRLPIAETSICTLVWPHYSSHAIYEDNRLQMVRSVASSQPETQFAAAPEEAAAAPPVVESAQPEPKFSAESFHDDVFKGSHDSASILNGFSLFTHPEESAPVPPAIGIFAGAAGENKAEPENTPPATLRTWPEYIGNLGLEIIRTKDFYGRILKGSNISHLFVGGCEEFLPELGDITREAMDLKPEELSPAEASAVLPSPLEAVCIGTGTERQTRFRRINLAPQEPIAERIKGITAPLILVLLVMIFLVTYLQDRALTAETARITAETTTMAINQEATNVNLASLSQLAGEFDNLQRQEISLKNEIGKIEAIRNSKINYSRLITAIAALLPSSLKCEKITFNGRQGVIEGLALHHRDLPVAVNNIQENPAFAKAFLKDVGATADRPSAPLSFRIMVETY